MQILLARPEHILSLDAVLSLGNTLKHHPNAQELHNAYV